MTTNIKRAQAAIEAAAFAKNGNVEDDLVDLLADIRHACDLAGIDFAKIDRRAYGHYCAERGGNRSRTKTPLDVVTLLPIEKDPTCVLCGDGSEEHEH
jgi:hypothetical protein